MPTVEEVTSKYIELRARKTAIAKKHSEEMAPLNQAMEAIESWLLNKMNEDGVNSYKTKEGTPYKSTTTSVKMEDPQAFKRFIFSSAATEIAQHLESNADLAAVNQVIDILLERTPWDMVDFRAGKKGIVAHLEEMQSLPPGVSTESSVSVNIRGS